MATEATFVLNLPTQTDRLTRDSRQTQTPQEPITDAFITSFKFLLRESPTSELFQFLPHGTNGTLFQLGVTGNDYYIGSRYVDRQNLHVFTYQKTS
jgi:hypothetical protein